MKPKDLPDMARFNWDDPFLLNDQLTEDEQMMRDAAYAYAQERLQPRVLNAFKHERTDPKVFCENKSFALSINLENIE